MSQPPNIVYVMFDQAKASAMSFLGNNEITMPYCDSLAEQGWVFENAYSAAPICTPSRASVHTGLFPQVHGVTCHQNRAPFNVPQLAELLQAAGYYPAAAGQPPRDSIRILEDTTGDGRADKVITFADRLNIPMGLLPVADGLVRRLHLLAGFVRSKVRLQHISVSKMYLNCSYVIGGNCLHIQINTCMYINS